MAESPEHLFLSQTFLNVLDKFSRLDLYGYTETDRRRFDFSCSLKRDWERPLVGQTLWAHERGIDKDIRTLVTESEADIWAYVIKDSVKNRDLIGEVVTDFQQSGYRDQLFRLKLFYVPSDFDADNEHARQVVSNVLESQVADDILFNVVFGNLTAHDIRYLQNLPAGQNTGLELAMLYHIATSERPIGFRDLCARFGKGTSAVKARLEKLSGAGLIWNVSRYLAAYRASLKGRVLLDILARLRREIALGSLTAELDYILRKLQLEPLPLQAENVLSHALGNEWTSQLAFANLVVALVCAVQDWGVDLDRIEFTVDERENDPSYRVMR